jgi:hypothetical protein
VLELFVKSPAGDAYERSVGTMILSADAQQPVVSIAYTDNLALVADCSFYGTATIAPPS